MNLQPTDNLIMATLAGSHLYGTNHPESDVDIRGERPNHKAVEALLIELQWGYLKSQ